jgi:hypothetical protein
MSHQEFNNATPASCASARYHTCIAARETVAGSSSDVGAGGPEKDPSSASESTSEKMYWSPTSSSVSNNPLRDVGLDGEPSQDAVDFALERIIDTLMKNWEESKAKEKELRKEIEEYMKEHPELEVLQDAERKPVIKGPSEPRDHLRILIMDKLALAEKLVEYCRYLIKLKSPLS